jgi:hypothetical protein
MISDYVIPNDRMEVKKDLEKRLKETILAKFV